MKLKKKSSLYPLLFGVVWLILALFTQSWEPALIGSIFVLIGIFLIVHDILNTKKELQIVSTMVETKNATLDEVTKTVKFREFGFWVESLSQVNALLNYVQQAVEIASSQGYSIGAVDTFGGVHELDTCYEVFSPHKYDSFEEAKRQLPLDFAEEESALDGHGFTTVNFEFLTVEVAKDGVTSHIRFCRGELTADDELYEIYLKTDWKRS